MTRTRAIAATTMVLLLCVWPSPVGRAQSNDPSFDVLLRNAKAGVDAKYFEIDTEFGHSATGIEWAKWGPDAEGVRRGPVEVARRH